MRMAQRHFCKVIPRRLPPLDVGEDRIGAAVGRRRERAVAGVQRHRHRQVEALQECQVGRWVALPHLQEPAVVGDPALALETEGVPPDVVDHDAVRVEHIGLRRWPRVAMRYGAFSQTETCDVLSAVNGERFQPAQRSRSDRPASWAMRSSSDGHT